MPVEKRKLDPRGYMFFGWPTRMRSIDRRRSRMFCGWGFNWVNWREAEQVSNPNSWGAAAAVSNVNEWGEL